jgi:hypothetical protein
VENKRKCSNSALQQRQAEDLAGAVRCWPEDTDFENLAVCWFVSGAVESP